MATVKHPERLLDHSQVMVIDHGQLSQQQVIKQLQSLGCIVEVANSDIEVVTNVACNDAQSNRCRSQKNVGYLRAV